VAGKGTSGDNRRRGLSIEQRNAIDLLVQGKSDQETADAVGVNRVTVTKWRNYDPWFQAELNQRRQDGWGGSVDRLRGLLPRLVFRTPNPWCAVTESHRKPLTILCPRPSRGPTDCARVRKMSLERLTESSRNLMARRAGR
jgi:hypothetical protein